jgi:hypothetical protein
LLFLLLYYRPTFILQKSYSSGTLCPVTPSKNKEISKRIINGVNMNGKMQIFKCSPPCPYV